MRIRRYFRNIVKEDLAQDPEGAGSDSEIGGREVQNGHPFDTAHGGHGRGHAAGDATVVQSC